MQPTRRSASPFCVRVKANGATRYTITKLQNESGTIVTRAGLNSSLQGSSRDSLQKIRGIACNTGCIRTNYWFFPVETLSNLLNSVDRTRQSRSSTVSSERDAAARWHQPLRAVLHHFPMVTSGSWTISRAMKTKSSIKASILLEEMRASFHRAGTQISFGPTISIWMNIERETSI